MFSIINAFQGNVKRKWRTDIKNKKIKNHKTFFENALSI